jgi:hypothetical protein
MLRSSGPLPASNSLQEESCQDKKEEKGNQQRLMIKCLLKYKQFSTFYISWYSTLFHYQKKRV